MGYARIATTPRQKIKSIKYCKIFQINGPKAPKVSMLGVEIFFRGKFVRSGPNSRKTFTYMVGDNFFYGNFVKNEPNGKKVSDYIEEALK